MQGTMWKEEDAHGIKFQAHRLHFGAHPESHSFPHRIQLICQWKLPDELQGLSLEPLGASKNVTFIDGRRARAQF
jgi:hypothetical protein